MIFLVEKPVVVRQQDGASVVMAERLHAGALGVVEERR